jgi:CRP/FNR family cyclic AMP-dependent transcriptional regulator
METLVTFMESTDLMRGLPPWHLKSIAECATRVRYEPGEFLARWGDVAESFWLVREGRLALELVVPGRGELTVAVATPGDFVGFSWLSPPYQMQFDVRALTAVEADRFDGRAVRARFSDDKWLGFELTLRFAQLAADRVEAMSMQLMDVYGDHPIEQG